MINMLEGYNIRSTAELKPTASVVMAERAMLSSTIDDLHSKINDISDRIELVRTFQTTKPFHDEYKILSSRKQKKLAEDNAPTLERFHSAGAKLRYLYPDGKFPSVSALEKQRDQLETERHSLYQQYTQLKKKSADIDKASQTKPLKTILKVCVPFLMSGGRRKMSWSKVYYFIESSLQTESCN